MKDFKPKALPVLIGSLPMKSYKDATELIFKYTPEIPLWAQLPMLPNEGMLEQFMSGLPGLVQDNDKFYFDTTKQGFDEEYLAFFEEYLLISEGVSEIESSIFSFTPETGKGFKEFLRQVDDQLDERIDKKGLPFVALKGQVTGPVTFGTAVKDQEDRSVFYNEQLREVMIKKLAMNAKWQAKEFAKRGAVPIVFIDEPSLAGFGTSAYITITKEDVTEAIEEIVDAVHSEDGLSGVHVCANTQWDVLLASKIDVISFDAYSYFDYLKKKTKTKEEYISKTENLEQLKYSAKAKDNLLDYLEEAALIREDKEDDEDNKKGVSLLTIHAAKGLEYDSVFIVGCEENLFPHWRSLASGDAALHEERRLMYVAMTRAKRFLYLTHANYRKGNFAYRSRFLDHIEEACS